MVHLPYSPRPDAAVLVAVAAVVFLLGYALYRAALPKPIPGIPYHRASATRLAGDALDMIRHCQQHGTVTDWFTLQGAKLQSPVFQLFLGPFRQPAVYVLDPREAQDVLLRRARDFDRSQFFAELFAGAVPAHHIVQPTASDRFRRGRRLLADTMGSGFLHCVAAPLLHRHALRLMALWRVKARLARGHAFAAGDDINCFALDSIWDASLGSQLDSVGQATELLLQYLNDDGSSSNNNKASSIDLPLSKDEPVTLPRPQFSADVASMKALTHSIDQAAVSPLPRQTHWLLRQMPAYRRAYAHKEKLVQASLNDAKSRLLNQDENTNNKNDNENDDNDGENAAAFTGITCATDHMVRREAQAAAKEGRAPEYDGRSAKDELFGFLVGGHDTTATMVMWMVKFLADHADVQTQLREALRTAYTAPSSDSNNSNSNSNPNVGTRLPPPTPEQITRTPLPFLDAVIEEVVRCAQTASLVVRKALREDGTPLLGYRIPRGVDVFFMTNGPGYMAPNDVNAGIPEAVRSATSRANKFRYWDDADVGAFKPARWLTTATATATATTATTGEEKEEPRAPVFDSRAGPTMQFGGGVRGCFGRKLAYLEMRILLVILLWTFELLQVPAGPLRSYEAFDSLTHKPKACYLLLKEL